MSHPPVDPYQSVLDDLAPNASRLKRSTNTRLGRALLVAVNLHLLAAGVYWVAAYATAEPAPPLGDGEIEIGSFLPPPTIREALPTPPSTGTVKPVRPAGLGTPTPVPDAEVDPEATVATEQERLADPGIGVVGLVPQVGNGDGDAEGSVPTTPRVPVVPKPGDPPSVPPVTETPEPVTEPGVLEISEVMPTLIGGIEALQARIEYPTFDRQAGLEGKVIVQFVVSETGVPSDIVVVRSVSLGLDRAAVDAVRRARFTPGSQNGRPVKVRYTLPVTFNLQ